MIPTSDSAVGMPFVYVIDDDADMRRSMHVLLRSLGYAAWPFASAEDFLSGLDGLVEAPITLDLLMPGCDGLALMAELASRAIDWPIIVTTGVGDVTNAVQSMKLGALEFLEKPYDPAALEASLKLAYAVIDERRSVARATEAARAMIARLTDREKMIIERLAGGASNRLVANDLGLSVRTIESYRMKALGKLGARNIAEAISRIYQTEVVRFPRQDFRGSLPRRRA